jgi:tRNA1(Val) A37 N6-methylase TrmN6
MVTVNLLELMEQYMKENGRMAAIMEKEDWLALMEKYKQVNLEMGNSFNINFNSLN